MKNNSNVVLMLLVLGGVSASAFAQPPGIDRGKDVGYVIDSRDNVVKSGTGLCWRTGYWTPAMAVAECDPDLVKKQEPPIAPTLVPPEPPAVPPTLAPAATPVAEKITLAAETLFEFDKSALRPEGQARLDDLVARIKDINLEVIIAVGHADRFGSYEYNQKLSERRAQSVKDYLVSKGIEPNRIYAEGKGKKEPVTQPGQCKGAKSKKVIACLQPDRRVEIQVIGTKTSDGHPR